MGLRRGGGRQPGVSKVWPSFAQMQTGGGEMLEPCGFLELLRPAPENNQERKRRKEAERGEKEVGEGLLLQRSSDVTL